MTSEMLDFDECAQFIDGDDHKQLKQEGDKLKVRGAELRDFQAEARKKRQTIAATSGASSGSRGPSSSGARSQAAARRVPKEGDIPQPLAKTLVPLGGFIWRARTAGSWVGRVPPCGEHSRAWLRHGERSACLQVLRGMWQDWCDLNAQGVSQVPVLGLFGESDGPVRPPQCSTKRRTHPLQRRHRRRGRAPSGGRRLQQSRQLPRRRRPRPRARQQRPRASRLRGAGGVSLDRGSVELLLSALAGHAQACVIRLGLEALRAFHESLGAVGVSSSRCRPNTYACDHEPFAAGSPVMLMMRVSEAEPPDRSLCSLVVESSGGGAASARPGDCDASCRNAAGAMCSGESVGCPDLVL